MKRAILESVSVVGTLLLVTTLFAEPFEDVTESLGLSGLHGTRSAWGDFDNDGWVDLYAGELWRNEQGERFTKVALPNGGAGVWGDYDNDGYLDLFLYGTHVLLRNGGDGTFTDMRHILPERQHKASLGAVWGDYNGDGFLDLYVGAYEIWQTQEEWSDVLLLNREGKRFEMVWQPPVRRARGVTAADFDEDGDLDVYVSNYRLQPNWLWLNNGSGEFQDVAGERGTDGDGDLGAWGHTIGSSFGDFDNDGHIDLFVGNFSHPPAYQDRCKFYRNMGPQQGFRFEDRSEQAALAWQESFATPTLADYDNDGFLDLYLTAVYNGNHCVLVRNTSGDLSQAKPDAQEADVSPVGDWSFTDVTDEMGLSVEPNYQATWADFDNDGDLDLASNGKLYRNPTSGNHWLKVRLNADETVNRAAIGAQVRVHVNGWVLTRQVEGGTGEGNQNDLVLHFGLGEFDQEVPIEVTWPNGQVQTMSSSVDTTITVDMVDKQE